MHTEELAMAVDLEKLEDKILMLQTVNGYLKKSFEISKIKLAAKGMEKQESTIHTLSSAKVERIGQQKGQMEAYIDVVAQLMKMPPDLKKHFMDQCCHEQKEIQLILGQRGGGMLMHEILPEQMGLVQHWLLPNIRIYKNPLTENLIIAGELGIDGRLVDDDYPTLYPTKEEMSCFKRKLDARKDLTADLGEKLQAKQFIPNEYNNSAHYYTEPKPRSGSVSTVNELYAELQLTIEEELGGPINGTSIIGTRSDIWENMYNRYKIDMSIEEEKIFRGDPKKEREPETESAYDRRCSRCRKTKGEAEDPKMREDVRKADALTGEPE